MPHKTDSDILSDCLRLARQGGKAVRPNPLVGCMIFKDGVEVGHGWHHQCGGSHAEVLALQAAGERARGAKLYVNLEPCNHQGRTPPCTEAIISAGIREVVIGMRDPNPHVKGAGMERLQQAGISCQVGVLEKECRALNQVFLKNTLHKLPFVTMKIAQSLDGYIAPALKGSPFWFTSDVSRRSVHRMRAGHEAVLVGGGTIRSDNPRLTLRDVSGDQPARVILSGSLRIPENSNILRDASRNRTIILTTEESNRNRSDSVNNWKSRDVSILTSPDRDGIIDLNQAMLLLYNQGIYSILLEGGSTVFSSFIDTDLTDEIHVFMSPLLFGSGRHAFAAATRDRGNAIADRFLLSSVKRHAGDIHAVYARKDDI